MAPTDHGSCDYSEKCRFFAAAKAPHDFVAGFQRLPGPPQRNERDRPSDRCVGDRCAKRRIPARTETCLDLVQGNQRFRVPPQIAEHPAFVEECRRRRLRKCLPIVRAEALYDFVPNGQRFFRPLQTVEGSSLVDQRQCNLFEVGLRFARSEMPDDLVPGIDRLLQPAPFDQFPRFPGKRLCSGWRCGDGGKTPDPVGERRRRCRKQILAVRFQRRQPDELLECNPVNPQRVAVQTRRLPRQPGTECLQFVGRVPPRHEADQGFDHRRRAAGAAHQIVDVVEPLGEVIELAPRAAACDFHGAAFGQSRQMRAALAGVEPCPFGDFPCRRRLPELREGEIDAPLLRRQRIEMALEILGVVVDQSEKIGHQFAERQLAAEPGDDGEQAGAAAGENPQRPDRSCGAVLTGDRPP